MGDEELLLDEEGLTQLKLLLRDVSDVQLKDHLLGIVEWGLACFWDLLLSMMTKTRWIQTKGRKEVDLLEGCQCLHGKVAWSQSMQRRRSLGWWIAWFWIWLVWRLVLWYVWGGGELEVGEMLR